MKEEDRVKFICFLLDALKDKNGWAGMIHLQKGCYIAQEMLGVPLDYKFIQCVYGPYAFDLRDEVRMLNDSFILSKGFPPVGYGVSYDFYEYVEKYVEAKKDNYKFKDEINFIAGWFLDKPVGRLVELAAAYMINEKYPDAEREERMKKLLGWKPFTTELRAKKSFDEVEVKVKELEEVEFINKKISVSG